MEATATNARVVPPEVEPEPPERSGIPPDGEMLPGPKFRGGREVVLCDGRTWKIPPLSLGQINGPAVHVFSHILKLMMLLADSKVPEALVVKDITGGVIDLAHMALTRNYPTLGLTKADVGELLDQENGTEVLKALYDLNGFVRETLRRLGMASPRPAASTETPAPSV
jgi:hypothetical protein